MTRLYRKTGTTPMDQWTPETDMTGVSVSAEDKAAGSPKEGDFVAYNPDNPADRWLVAAKYHRENYEECSPPHGRYRD